MTFDDGFQAHYTHVRSILNTYGFKGTFYINPKTINKRINNFEDTDERYAYWDQLAKMAREGHEIASHSFSHPHLNEMPIGDEKTRGTLLYELYESKRIIEEKIPNYNCINIAYPYGFHNSQLDEYISKYYEAARSAGNTPNSSSPSEEEFLDLNSKLILWRKTREKPEDDLKKLKRFIRWIKKESISTEKWAILVAHEVLPFSKLSTTDSFEPTSNEWLIGLCEWLKNASERDEIWVDTVANVTKYIKERDYFDYAIKTKSMNELKITIKTTFDPLIYNFPLTIEIIVPESWHSVELSYNGQKEIKKPYRRDNQTYITTNVIPHDRLLTLKQNK